MQQEMSVLGIDIAKRVFHAVGMDNTGKIVLRKRLPRHDLMPFQGSGQNDVHPEHGMRHQESMWSPQAESPRIGMTHTVGAAHRLGLH